MKTTIQRCLPKIDGSFFLLGPRGTGKTTWLKREFPHAKVIDLLEPDTLRSYQARPEYLREVVEGSLPQKTFVIDEVQMVPQILSCVHALLERIDGLVFVLTGSSARKLKREGVDLLAGRAARLTMHPFTAAELGEAFDLNRALTFGLLPVVHGARNQAKALSAYINLYLREEIQQEGLVRNLGPFTRFLEAATFSHGSQLVSSDIARDCAVGRTTVDSYLKILYDLMIAEVLPVFTKRAKRVLVSHGKFYFFDVGVFRTLRPKGPLDRPSEIEGAALEGLVFQHLRAWNDSGGGENRLYFWRTKAGVEVDFIVYGPNAFHAIEVKNADHVTRHDASGLEAFHEDYPEATCTLLYRGTNSLKLTEHCLAIPIEHFLRNVVPSESLPVGGTVTRIF